MQLRPYQEQAIQATLDWFAAGKEKPCVVLPTGCHAKGTRVIMYDGSIKNVEDVAAGDILMGDDNTPRNVLNLARGKELMYKITPISGEPFIVNENHILSLKATNEGKKWASSYNGSEYEFIRVKDLLNKSKYYRHIMKLHRKPGIELSAKTLPIDPYFLGIMLGDGSMQHHLALTSADKEIIDYLYDYTSKLGCYIYINQKKGNKAATYCICHKDASRWNPNPITKIIRDLGLWGKTSGDKFIPELYKMSSVNDRLQLLAGLIDTDGSLSQGVTFDFISKSKELAEDVQYIARSVGLCANLRPCKKYCQTGNGGIFYRVSITGNIDIVPTRITRKKGRCRLQKKNPMVTGFSIECVGVNNFYGFELDGNHLYLTSDFIIHHNTGKSLVQAELIRRILEDAPYVRILALCHSKELVRQNYDETISIWPACPAGVYSAGLNRRERAQVLFAGIQSIHNKASFIGHYDICIIDECHSISGKNKDTMYHNLFADLHVINPRMQILGLSATPYRLDSGNLVPNVFNGIAYEYNIIDAIKDGYLCEVISAPTKTVLNTDGVKMQGKEFAPGALEKAVDKEHLTRACIEEVIKNSYGRKSWLGFASGTEHAEHINDILNEYGIDSRFITDKTPSFDRDDWINKHKSGELKCLVNNAILTTGYNNPMLDLIFCMRPTQSKGLWVQMVGRATRLYHGKQNASLLDFGGNLERHGPIDKIKGDDKKEGRGGDAPRKQCPKCFEAVFASARFCPCCNYEFQFDESIKIEAIASNAAVLSIQLDKEQKKMEQRAAKSIEDLIKLGYKRGYKNPTYWAQCIMKARKK